MFPTKAVRKQWLFPLLITAGLSVAAAALLWSGFGASAEELRAEADRALRLGNYEGALRLAARVPEQSPHYAAARLIAGEAATKLDRFEEALEHYWAVPDDGSPASATALYCTGDLLFHLGKAGEAEQAYRRVLEFAPDDLLAREQLARLLTAFGRRWEAAPHLLELVRSGRFTSEHLLWLGNTESISELPREIDQYRDRAPDDPLPWIALAKDAILSTDFPTAETLAEKAVALGPDQIEAWAVLGRARLEAAPERLSDWDQELPRTAEQHPDVWLVRGLAAQRRGEARPAVRCFWEAVRIAPNHRAANYHLGQTLVTLGGDEQKQAIPFLRRASLLHEFEGVLDLIYRNPASLEHLRRAAELTEALGRVWESWGWCRAALALRSDQRWAQQTLRALQPRLRPDLPRTLPESNPALLSDFSHYPLTRPRAAVKPAPAATEALQSPSSVRFRDFAQETGIDFTYFNGSVPPTEGKLIFQLMGGGAAVLDFDRDCWPDLCLTQGGPVPLRDSGSGYHDRLYRKDSLGRFIDVTGQGGLVDGGYGQGAAAGDFDSDGFPDLYVANVGRNRLQRNNGDGTFTDVTEDCGLEAERWTSSCLIADLNGDGLPDLYDVNYLAGDKIHWLTCRRDGKVRSCDPKIFEGEQDQFFLNLGDGRFEDATEAAGFIAPDGKGLGIVAFDPFGTGKLSLFVANDTVANFFFANEVQTRGGSPRFRESALLSGLGFDADGKAQACMGVAVDDSDGDGRLDLFVTNFFKEANTLYRQRADLLFEDATREADLYEPTYAILGFGTQFIDGELDGLPDLIVTNGHIDDNTDRGIPYEMHPQYFRNGGGGRFTEVTPSELGPFFEGQYLGRGLARLDWNRDGREDVIISHLDCPVALLTNETEHSGHFLTLRFCGVLSDRDAIGATVTIEAGGRTSTRQLTAGDGYMASNQRQLVFGLGPAEQVDRIAVRWPSGHKQTFEHVPANREFVLVEGQPTLTPLPGLTDAGPRSVERR